MASNDEITAHTMKDWRSFMLEIMRELEGEANLTADIYPLVQLRGTNLGPNWKARVRATLEENSSDSDSWIGNHDLFTNKKLGDGNWSLRKKD